jgi:hypothetical protein
MVLQAYFRYAQIFGCAYTNVSGVGLQLKDGLKGVDL